MRTVSDAMVDVIARVAHEANRAWCYEHGDDSQPRWDDAPDWQRESARNGVVFVIANPAADAEASHDSWMFSKSADGWVYGEVKRPDAKTHPNLRPYAELPEFQRRKDALFLAIVRALAPAAA